MTLAVTQINKPINYTKYPQYTRFKDTSNAAVSDIHFKGKLGNLFKGKRPENAISNGIAVYSYVWGLVELGMGIALDAFNVKSVPLLETIQKHIPVNLDLIAYGYAAFDFARGYVFQRLGKADMRIAFKKVISKLKSNKPNTSAGKIIEKTKFKGIKPTKQEQVSA